MTLTKMYLIKRQLSSEYTGDLQVNSLSINHYFTFSIRFDRRSDIVCQSRSRDRDLKYLKICKFSTRYPDSDRKQIRKLPINGIVKLTFASCLLLNTFSYMSETMTPR